jgi:hypothetical protein
MTARTAPLILFGPTIFVGLVALVVSAGARDADPQLISAQRHPPSIAPTALADAVALAREPLPGDNGRPARSARCRPGSTGGPLHNPWSCDVRYPSGHTIRYRIRVRLDGSFHGQNADGSAAVDGHVRAPGGG